MKLADLDPRFIKTEPNGDWREVATKAEADGIIFLCPLCFNRNHGSDVGVHSVICFEPSVPPSIRPGPGRWHMDGTGFDDLTLRGDSSSSVALSGGCRAHFFVVKGVVSGSLK